MAKESSPRPLVRELPGEPGGATGTKYFHVLAVGKGNEPNFPFNIPNEKIASELGRAMGLRIPEILLYKAQISDPVTEEVQTRWMSFSHFIPTAESGDSMPSGSAFQVQESFLNNPGLLEGMVCFDIFVCNNDRRLQGGGNLHLDEEGNVWLIDNANSLFYRPRRNAGVEAGIERLKSVENSLGNLFDKPHDFVDKISMWDSVEDWCQRIDSIPNHFVEAIVRDLPTDVLGHGERDFLADFIIRRKGNMLEIIEENSDLFPHLKRVS